MFRWPVVIALVLATGGGYFLGSKFGALGVLLIVPVAFILGVIGATLSAYLENRRVP